MVRISVTFSTPEAGPPIEAGSRHRLLPLFARYLAHRDDAKFRALYAQFAPGMDPGSRWRLLWPAPR